MIIDSRTKVNGRTAVHATAVVDAKLANLKQRRREPITSKGKGKSAPKVVPPVTFDHEPPKPVAYTPLAARPVASPLTWGRYSKDVNLTISGLGSTRSFKRYPGKSFPMAAAVWRESPAEADRAMKAGLKAAAAAHKTATGAATSL